MLCIASCSSVELTLLLRSYIPRLMMTDSDMAQQLRILRELVPQFENALNSFKASPTKFRLLKTVHPLSSGPAEPQRPSSKDSPRTLFILDSSFNPPSVAHRTLVQSVLEKASADRYPGPYRLLLLFSTMNADKAPSPASFHQRLTMMTLFARDILDDLRKDPQEQHHIVPVDIGVTTAPYYTDKSKAIEAEGSEWYPDKPKHIHLVGFDTLTRFFASKYYSSFDPPLSALNPYFDEGGHRLRVTLRPDDSYGTVDEQEVFLDKLGNGEMEREGGKREWADRVELVPPNPRAGVSSTRIRKAANSSSWQDVRQLCTQSVASWIEEERLYADDDSGTKLT